MPLTDEEWVRQHFLNFLINHRQCPQGLIRTEMGIKVFDTVKRTDITVFDKIGKPLMIVECKAPDIKLSQDVFDQILRYNLTLKTQYLVITNGLETFSIKADLDKGSYAFLKDVPFYNQMI